MRIAEAAGITQLEVHLLNRLLELADSKNEGTALKATTYLIDHIQELKARGQYSSRLEIKWVE